MQSFWDLLPATLWPSQPFISPDEQARTLQALWTLQAAANSSSPATGGPGNLASPSASQAPDLARSASDAGATGGILGAVFGPSAAPPATTSFQGLIPPPQQGPSFVPVASTADQLAPNSPPATVPAAPGLQHPIDTTQLGRTKGVQPYFPPQNFVQHMISGTPEPGPLWDEATRKSVVDYAVSRGIAGSVAHSTAGEITKEPPPGAALAPWSAAHGLLDLPFGFAAVPGLTEAIIRGSSNETPMTDEEAARPNIYYIPRPGVRSPPHPAAPYAHITLSNPLDLVTGPLQAFHEAWDPPLHPPPNSTFDDGGTIYVNDANGVSRPWSEIDPDAARAYYEQERRRTDFGPSFAVKLLAGGASFAEREAVGISGSRLGNGTKRLPKRSVETTAPGASPGETAAPLAQAGAATSPLLARPALTGQTHHAISKRVCTALDKVPSLAGIYEYRDPRFITRAIDSDAHRGYQTWHRNLDSEIAAYVEKNRRLTPRAFERYLRDRYAQPDLLARFPNGL